MLAQAMFHLLPGPWKQESGLRHLNLHIQALRQRLLGVFFVMKMEGFSLLSYQVNKLSLCRASISWDGGDEVQQSSLPPSCSGVHPFGALMGCSWSLFGAHLPLEHPQGSSTVPKCCLSLVWSGQRGTKGHKQPVLRQLQHQTLPCRPSHAAQALLQLSGDLTGSVGSVLGCRTSFRQHESCGLGFFYLLLSSAQLLPGPSMLTEMLQLWLSKERV